VITSGTFDAARLPLATTGAAGAVIVGTGLGVSSGTVSVTYGTNSTSACRGDDSRLSDTRTPTDGSVTTAKLANDAVTYAKLQNVSATDRLLGRSSAGAGDVEEITCTSTGRAIIGAASEAAARSAISVQPTASPAFTGAATFDNTGNVVPLTVTNTGTANSFVVNDASGDTTPFVIDASGNVGIGASPSQRLHIHEPSANDCYARWTNTDTGTSSGLLIGLNGNEQGVIRVEPNKSLFLGANNTDHIQLTGAGQLLVTAGSASACGVAFSGDTDTGIAQLSAAGANTLSICTGGGERVRIDASGNVGIKNTPTTVLEVGTLGKTPVATANAACFWGANLATATTGNANLQILSTDNQAADLGGTLGLGGSYNTTQSVSFAVIAGRKTNSTSSNAGGYMQFFTRNQGGGVLSEGMRLTDDAYLLVGYTTSNGAYKLQVNSQIYATNATVATSDARFKTRVEPLSDATAVIAALRPVAFDFIPHAERNFATERQVGLIAQEAEAALAGCDYADSVVAQCGDHLGLAYEKLVPVLIKALQESNARIAALEERNNA